MSDTDIPAGFTEDEMRLLHRYLTDALFHAQVETYVLVHNHGYNSAAARPRLETLHRVEHLLEAWSLLT